MQHKTPALSALCSQYSFTNSLSPSSSCCAPSDMAGNPYTILLNRSNMRYWRLHPSSFLPPDWAESWTWPLCQHCSVALAHSRWDAVHGMAGHWKTAVLLGLRMSNRAGINAVCLRSRPLPIYGLEDCQCWHRVENGKQTGGDSFCLVEEMEYLWTWLMVLVHLLWQL